MAISGRLNCAEADSSSLLFSQLLEEAIGLDPTNSMALADLAFARHFEAVFGWGDGPAESHARLGEAARKAVAADDGVLFLGGTGTIGQGTVGLFLIGLPALALGTWAGLKLFGKLDETGFRRVVLVLLLVSGVSLLLRVG